MALDPSAIDDYLARPFKKFPDFKTLTRVECQQLIEARTGLPFRRSKGPKLFAHQMRMLTACVMLDHTLAYLGMRMGKTYAFMMYAEHMRLTNMWRGQGILITPRPVVQRDAWELQAEDYTNLRYLPVYSTNDEELIRATESDADVVMVPWTSLIRMLGQKQTVKRRGRAPENKFILDPAYLEVFGEHFTLGCIDELHHTNNPASARFAMGKALLGGPNVAFSVGMTGTAFGRADPFQVWAPTNIIDHKLFGNSYYFFKMAYGKEVRNPFTRWGKELKFDKKKTKIFQERLGSIAIAYKLSEVRKSDIRNEPVTVQMQGEQLREYLNVVDKVIDRSKTKEISRKSLENVYIKLRRISAGTIPFIDHDGNRQYVHLPNHAKERWLDEALESGMFDSPGILFHDYTETGQFLVNWLKKHKVKHGWLHGNMRPGHTPVRDFMRGKIDWIVTQIQSGSEGIDLSRADYSIYYEGNPSPILRAQSAARPLGPGRGTRPLHQFDLLASAIDKRVLGLATKGIQEHDRMIYTPTSLAKLLK